MRKRIHNDNERKGAPAWMVTYADTVTLLLAFFVLLFTFSSIDLQKFQEVMSAFQGSIGVLEGGRTIDTDFSLETQISQVSLEQLQRLHNELQNFLQVEGLEDTVELQLEQRGIILRFSDRLFFELGQATLKPEAIDILQKLAPIIKDIPNPIRIEGHTDNLPINNERFPSNWELSTYRSTNVIRHLIEENGFDPNNLSAAGYGEYRPIVPNTTAKNRAQNRRVDIVIMRVDLWDKEPN